MSLDARLGPLGEHRLICLEEIGAAVGVTRIVHNVSTDVDAVGVDALGETGGDGQEHDVTRGDVGDGDLLGEVAGTVHGDVDVLACEGGTEGCEVDVYDHMVDAVKCTDILGRLQFAGMALTVAEGQGGDLAPVLPGLCQGGRGIESPGQEDYRFRHGRSP